MLAFAYYLLKVIICSAVLFGYYWFFLRNKIYHVYNRYYLLTLVLISLAFPLLSINIFHESSSRITVIKMLQVVNAGDEYLDEIIINIPVKTTLGAEQILIFIYGIVCIVLLLLLVQMLFSIFKLIRGNEKIKIKNINFINTDAAKGTPFSFFQFIFWNKQIDMQNAAGIRIFKHELAHIQEWHSWDKMFINLVLIVFWINPIFWLVRKELSMIHEFIADKKAVEDGDTAAFAAMILEATYPQQTLFLTNSFFYSPIKRRLMMLTKIKNNRTSYISRLLVLPLLVVVFVAFTLKAKEIGADKTIKKSVEQLMNKITGSKSTDSKLENELTGLKNIYTGKRITVVIDAGHGGNDGGAVNKDGIFEKDIALQLIKKIDKLNTNDNIKIILSRTDDVFSDPKQKAEFAKTQNPDLFISIHLDGSPKSKWNTVSGMNVFVARNDIANTEKSKLLASSIIEAFKNNYSLNVPTTISQRNGGIWILQANIFPSILIEAGYLTNDIDATYLLSKKGQEAFAINVLEAINNYAINNLKSGNFTFKEIVNDTLFYFNSKQIKKSEIKLILQRYKKIDVKSYDSQEAANKFKTSNNEIVVEVFGRNENINEIKHEVNQNNVDINNPQASLLNEDVATVTIKQNKKNIDKVSLTDNSLYVIDGKISDKKAVEVILPENIESVNILKGSSALAPYGEKGKYGVVEITTKVLIMKQETLKSQSENETKSSQDTNRIVLPIYK